jgi:DNA-binding CsgD family transcriptional regulator
MADATLTEKQQRVYDLIVKGKSRDEISRQLDIATGPLGSIIAGIKRKGALDAQGQPLKAATNGHRPESDDSAPKISEPYPAPEPLDGIVGLLEQNAQQIRSALDSTEAQQMRYDKRRKEIAAEIGRLTSEDEAIEQAQGELHRLADQLDAAWKALDH